MKFFLDTANLNEIREAAKLGFLDGVTTNPTLIAKEKRRFDDAIREICEACPGPAAPVRRGRASAPRDSRACRRTGRGSRRS